jgi:hypothetical protein
MSSFLERIGSSVPEYSHMLHTLDISVGCQNPDTGG